MSLEYWRRYLAGKPPLLLLPTDWPRTSGPAALRQVAATGLVLGMLRHTLELSVYGWLSSSCSAEVDLSAGPKQAVWCTGGFCPSARARGTVEVGRR